MRKTIVLALILVVVTSMKTDLCKRTGILMVHRTIRADFPVTVSIDVANTNDANYKNSFLLSIKTDIITEEKICKNIMDGHKHKIIASVPTDTNTTVTEKDLADEKSKKLKNGNKPKCAVLYDFDNNYTVTPKESLSGSGTKRYNFEIKVLKMSEFNKVTISWKQEVYGSTVEVKFEAFTKTTDTANPEYYVTGENKDKLDTKVYYDTELKTWMPMMKEEVTITISVNGESNATLLFQFGKYINYAAGFGILITVKKELVSTSRLTSSKQLI